LQGEERGNGKKVLCHFRSVRNGKVRTWMLHGGETWRRSWFRRRQVFERSHEGRVEKEPVALSLRENP